MRHALAIGLAQADAPLPDVPRATFALYPLSLAHVNDRHRSHEVVDAKSDFAPLPSGATSAIRVAAVFPCPASSVRTTPWSHP